jgi:uncharacterized protein (DUF1501 family)
VTVASEIQTSDELIAGGAASGARVVSQPLEDIAAASYDLIIPAAPGPAFDLFGELLSLGEYIPGPQPISSPAPQRAATSEYDLRPLGDDLETGGQSDDLLADILEESALALPL